MELMIDNTRQTFIPVKLFRSQYNLPVDFGVAMFEPKDFSGLGRIDRAGSELNIVRQAVLEALPKALPLAGWLEYLPTLAQLFESKLNEVNPQVGLKSVEIEFAVGGFTDVCQALIYAMIRARSAGEPAPGFQQVYYDWLSSTVRLSAQAHHYIHNGKIWAIQVLHHAYGRTGLVIWMDDETCYVQDNSLGCPAEGFMAALLADVASHILTAAA